MPRRDDIHKIMLIGSGPIIIGQACEFDYSGTQACKALREEGYEVVLINSNPATIMTDPDMADATYVEPITPEAIEKIIAKERPDALLPTLGGQTGLNTALRCAELGILEKYGVEMIGANAEVINRAEDRELFKDAMKVAEVPVLESIQVNTVEKALEAAEKIGFPVIIRPSYTLGGTGGGTAENPSELREIASGGIKASLNDTVLIEESVYGWKEYELEVMRDKNDNVVIICTIENLDHMGLHTGDSITVAPAQTLSDPEFQMLRDASIRVMRAIGVETGGSNVQFCIHPDTGRMAVIEMNPRVSRSSALASKATGYPIAKIAAKLAVGYTLDELPNDITKDTPASFEPTLDYCVVKIPRFAFEKFSEAEALLGVSMKSVGETMAIGRNMKEALQKAFRGLERGLSGLDLKAEAMVENETLAGKFAIAAPDRLFKVKSELKAGKTVDALHEITHIDPWFIDIIAQICELEARIQDEELTPELLREAKEDGFSDQQIADLQAKGQSEMEIRALRKRHGILPTYRLVDTCAGEFEALTPYYYSSYSSLDESKPSDRKKIMVLGSGPNRIGQGIEFDYCCVHTVMALRELGYETIMVNSNPETVSTDYDTSDKLFFEPLTFEDVMNIFENEKPEGVIVQMGGQTPLNLSTQLAEAGVPLLGTPADSIDRAEDRERCRVMLDQLGLKQPNSATVMSPDQAIEVARKIGLPVMIRPSFVLGGRAMMIAYEEKDIVPYVEEAFRASPDYPVLIDRFLDNAIEVDVDLLCDGVNVYVGGVMEHVEPAGVHSGDSACCVPPFSLDDDMVGEIKAGCSRIALELKVKGLLNVQVAVFEDEMYIIEINPRASRTIPYLSKATNIPLAKMAAKISAGKMIPELGLPAETPKTGWYAVKEAVLPFNRFAGVDPILSPEMKSTGEVMGIDRSFEAAYWKSQIAAYQNLPMEGTVFLSAKDKDKPWMIDLGQKLHAMGFHIVATDGTADGLAQQNVKAERLRKLAEEASPNILDLMKEGRVDLIINTSSGPSAREDEVRIRGEAILRGIALVTTQWGARATIAGIEHMRHKAWDVTSLQDFFKELD
ncbi:MAG: carbamoyl-phosphate synthase large subunit [Verrucomicrobiota bacterium]